MRCWSISSVSSGIVRLVCDMIRTMAAVAESATMIKINKCEHITRAGWLTEPIVPPRIRRRGLMDIKNQRDEINRGLDTGSGAFRPDGCLERALDRSTLDL